MRSRRHGGSVGSMGATTLEQLTTMLALAAASLLTVIVGLAKNWLVWQRRPPFGRRWRR